MTNTIDSSAIATRLSEYIATELLDGQQVGQDDDLVADGMIDSLGFVRLVSFIQDSFNVVVPAEDLTIENFHSSRALANYIHARL